ncbi:unnamed protein product, partial [Dicrocoelium dendriticum]
MELYRISRIISKKSMDSGLTRLSPPGLLFAGSTISAQSVTFVAAMLSPLEVYLNGTFHPL